MKPAATGLDREHRILRDRLRTAINSLDAYERLLLSGAMGGPEGPTKRKNALATIHRCVRDAANTVGIEPNEKRLLLDALLRFQADTEKR